MDWRRIEILDSKKQQAFEQLVRDKGLTREDLMLILKTVKLKE